MPVTGDHDEDSAAEGSAAPVPWHHSTPAVLGASLVALVAIALLVGLAMLVARQFNEPEPAPINYGPAYPLTSSGPTSTTSSTITSTSPPETTDFGLPPPGSTTSGSETPSETTSETTSSAEPTETAETERTRTTRNRPRTNVTRTLYPLPNN